MLQYKVPNLVIQRFCEKACQNKKNGHFIETLAFLVGLKESNVITVTDIVFGQQTATSINVDDHGIQTGNPIDNDTCAWIYFNSPMKKKYGSKLSIASWVHSHVEDVKCCFSSVDMHTQFTLNKMYPDILGLVFQIGKDSSLENYDFYGLTKKGHHGLSQCKKSGTKFHEGCFKESFYASQKDMITFFDGLLEVHDFFDQDDTKNEGQTTINVNDDTIQDQPVFSNSLGKKIYSFGYDMESDLVKNEKMKCEGCDTFFFIESFFKHVSHSKRCRWVFDEANKKSEVSNMKNMKEFHENKKKTKPISRTKNRACEGCGKQFTDVSFFKHVSHSKKCKAAYGDGWEKMKRQRRLETTSRYYYKNQEMKQNISKENMKKLRAEDRSKQNRKMMKDMKEVSSLHIVKCKGCNESFMSNKILKHISQVDECFTKYKEKDLNLLKNIAKDRKHETVTMWRKDHQSQVIAQEEYRYDFFKDNIKSNYEKKDISALPWDERNKLREQKRKKKKEIQINKWGKAFEERRMREAKKKIENYLKGEPLYTTNLHFKNSIEKHLEPWIELFCEKDITDDMKKEFNRFRNEIKTASKSFENEISEVTEQVKIIVSGSMTKNQKEATKIVCKREEIAEKVIKKLDKKIRDFWYILAKEIGKSMKAIGDKIGVKFIYLYENPNNPKYYWRRRGSKKETAYDESSNDSDESYENTDSDPDDPDG